MQSKKLQLRKETLRTLESPELVAVQGGAVRISNPTENSELQWRTTTTTITIIPVTTTSLV